MQLSRPGRQGIHAEARAFSSTDSTTDGTIDADVTVIVRQAKDGRTATLRSPTTSTLTATSSTTSFHSHAAAPMRVLFQFSADRTITPLVGRNSATRRAADDVAHDSSSG
jgi:hypothetical protein